MPTSPLREVLGQLRAAATLDEQAEAVTGWLAEADPDVGVVRRQVEAVQVEFEHAPSHVTGGLRTFALAPVLELLPLVELLCRKLEADIALEPAGRRPRPPWLYCPWCGVSEAGARAYGHYDGCSRPEYGPSYSAPDPVFVDLPPQAKEQLEAGRRIADAMDEAFNKPTPPLPGDVSYAEAQGLAPIWTPEGVAQLREKKLPEREWIDSPDAMVWAQQFCARFPYVGPSGNVVDDPTGLMVGWFSNVMACAERNATSKAEGPPEEGTITHLQVEDSQGVHRHACGGGCGGHICSTATGRTTCPKCIEVAALNDVPMPEPEHGYAVGGIIRGPGAPARDDEVAWAGPLIGYRPKPKKAKKRRRLELTFRQADDVILLAVDALPALHRLLDTASLHSEVHIPLYQVMLIAESLKAVATEV